MVTETDRVLGLLEEGVESAIASLAVNITAELAEETPVDTGWARANWVPNIGSPFTGNSENLSDEARRAGVGAQAAAQSAAQAQLISYKLGQGSVFITNNVPYIVPLNEGSSQRAPAGFVQIAIESGIRSLRGLGS